MSSSDLELARSISRLLSATPAGATAPGHAPVGAVEPPDPSRFLRFRQHDVATSPAAPPRPAPKPSRAEPLAPPPQVADWGFDVETLTPLLEQARDAAGADAAFVTDPRGVVVASVGAFAEDAAGPYGSRLVVALERAREISGSAAEETSVVVEAGGRALTAFTASTPDGLLVTIGFQGTSPTPRPVREALRRVLAGR
ncbi:MAG: hypothetical protein U0529_12020 [Thermoanaerobaculia bacterium]